MAEQKTSVEKVISTKGKIIFESLNLFSQQGYEGVSMRDIAAAVGIKGASIYNHFKGKEDIFNAIIKEMSKRYENTSQTIDVPNGDMSEVTKTYMEISHESLQQIASGLFLYFLRDDFASKFRKMLIAEQYRNELARITLQNYFFDSPINFQTELFKSMIIGGIFRDFDPHIMALHFYSPIFLLLNKYDYNQDNETEALSVLAKHVKQFSEIYCI